MTENITEREGNTQNSNFKTKDKQYITIWWYLFAAGDKISFLVPDGEGREPLDFFGKTVPLLTVVFKGSVWTSGLAVKWKQINKQINAEIYKFRSVHNTWSKT